MTIPSQMIDRLRPVSRYHGDTLTLYQTIGSPECNDRKGVRAWRLWHDVVSLCLSVCL